MAVLDRAAGRARGYAASMVATLLLGLVLAAGTESPDSVLEPAAGMVLPDPPLLDAWTEARSTPEPLLDAAAEAAAPLPPVSAELQVQSWPAPAEDARAPAPLLDGTEGVGEVLADATPPVLPPLQDVDAQPWTGALARRHAAWVAAASRERPPAGTDADAARQPLPPPAWGQAPPDDLAALQRSLPDALRASRAVLATVAVVGAASFAMAAATLLLGNITWASAEARAAPLGTLPGAHDMGSLGILAGLGLLGVVALCLGLAAVAMVSSAGISAWLGIPGSGVERSGAAATQHDATQEPQSR